MGDCEMKAGNVIRNQKVNYYNYFKLKKIFLKSFLKKKILFFQENWPQLFVQVLLLISVGILVILTEADIVWSFWMNKEDWSRLWRLWTTTAASSLATQRKKRFNCLNINKYCFKNILKY